MSLRPKKDGEHIAGTRRTISAASIAAALGLKERVEEPPMKLTPAAAAAKAAGDTKRADELMEQAKEHSVERVIPPGRGIIDFWGLSGEDVPLGAEAGMAPPEPKRPAQEGWGDEPSEAQPMTQGPDADAVRAEAENLRREARESVRGTIKRGVEALESNDPERIKRAEAEAKDALSFGEKVKRALKVEKL